MEGHAFFSYWLSLSSLPAASPSDRWLLTEHTIGANQFEPVQTGLALPSSCCIWDLDPPWWAICTNNYIISPLLRYILHRLPWYFVALSMFRISSARLKLYPRWRNSTYAKPFLIVVSSDVCTASFQTSSSKEESHLFVKDTAITLWKTTEEKNPFLCLFSNLPVCCHFMTYGCLSFLVCIIACSILMTFACNLLAYFYKNNVVLFQE